MPRLAVRNDDRLADSSSESGKSKQCGNDFPHSEEVWTAFLRFVFQPGLELRDFFGF